MSEIENNGEAVIEQMIKSKMITRHNGNVQFTKRFERR